MRNLSQIAETPVNPVRASEIQQRRDEGTLPNATPEVTNARSTLTPQPIDEDGDQNPKTEIVDQGIPLQEIWPVSIQKKTVEAGGEISSRNRPDISDIKTPLTNENLSRIQRLMTRPEIAQPTSSKLEIIPPRRPRPANPAGESGPETRLDQPDEVPSTKSRQSLQEPQNELDKNDNSLNQGDQQMVQTEIGPLPQDLWKLLDQPIPSANQNVTQPGTIKNIGESNRRQIFRTATKTGSIGPISPNSQTPPISNTENWISITIKKMPLYR